MFSINDLLHGYLLIALSHSPSAEEILNKYLKGVGGREAILAKDAKEKEPKTKKRGRAASTTSTPESRPNGRKHRKSEPHPASTTPPASLKNAEFMPPTGSWEATFVLRSPPMGTRFPPSLTRTSK